MSDVVEEGILVYFDNAQALGAEPSGEPRCGNEALWVRIFLEWGMWIELGHGPVSFLNGVYKRDLSKHNNSNA